MPESSPSPAASAPGRWAVPAAVVFAIGVPAFQALAPFGLSASEFADDGNQTLRAAGYAFSIWSLIYAALAAYAVYQLRARGSSPVLERLRWPSVFSITACGVWIAASAFDQKLATVLIIFAAAAVLIAALIKPLPRSRAEFWLAVVPLSLLAGWLTIASVINLLTVLTAWGVITGASAPATASLGLAALMVVALTVTWRTRLIAYAAPIAWGLLAVYVAEQDHRPMIALACATSAAALAAFAVWAWRRRAIAL